MNMNREGISKRIGELQTILSECETISNGQMSEFWQILRRIYSTKALSYKQDCYSAAEHEDKSIRNFLGRMEALDWAVSLVEYDFLEQAVRAKDELESLRAALKELEEIDRGVDSIIQDPTYNQPGTI